MPGRWPHSHLWYLYFIAAEPRNTAAAGLVVVGGCPEGES